MKKHSEPNYEVAMVGLDLSEMDDRVVEYVGILNRTLTFKKIIFVHITEEQDLPKEVLDQYPNLVVPLDESLTLGIERKVASILKDTDTEHEVIVQEGSPLESFLKLSKKHNTDLIILGRKKNLDGTGMLAGHIVRKSHASILFVTETFSPHIRDILLPADFSTHSEIAFEVAQQFRKNSSPRIRFSHLYSVPIGYYKTGKTYEEFAEIMKKYAVRDYNIFRNKNEIAEDLTCDYLLCGKGSKAKLINEHAHESGADLILIGSRGRTATSALLLGSIVEKLLQLDFDIPVLVVKNKGENMGFFEAFLKL